MATLLCRFVSKIQLYSTIVNAVHIRGQHFYDIPALVYHSFLRSTVWRKIPSAKYWLEYSTGFPV